MEWHNKLRPVNVQAITLDRRPLLDPDASSFAEPKTMSEIIAYPFKKKQETNLTWCRDEAINTNGYK